jgi:hypothetical protein
MQGMFGLKISAMTAKLEFNNRVPLLSEANLIIDCTDNFKARNLIKEFCDETGIECLHGCLSADGTLARAVWSEHFTPDAEGGEGEATCEDGQNLPFHGLAGALIAQVAQKFIGSGEKKSWQLTPSSLVRIA